MPNGGAEPPDYFEDSYIPLKNLGNLSLCRGSYVKDKSQFSLLLYNGKDGCVWHQKGRYVCGKKQSWPISEDYCPRKAEQNHKKSRIMHICPTAKIPRRNSEIPTIPKQTLKHYQTPQMKGSYDRVSNERAIKWLFSF